MSKTKTAPAVECDRENPPCVSHEFIDGLTLHYSARTTVGTARGLPVYIYNVTILDEETLEYEAIDNTVFARDGVDGEVERLLQLSPDEAYRLGLHLLSTSFYAPRG